MIIHFLNMTDEVVDDPEECLLLSGGHSLDNEAIVVTEEKERTTFSSSVLARFEDSFVVLLDTK